jgi:hypothetical protein
MPGCATLGSMKKKQYLVWIARVNPTFIEVDSTSQAGAERAAVEKWKRTEGRPVIVDCREIRGYRPAAADRDPSDTSGTKPTV